MGFKEKAQKLAKKFPVATEVDFIPSGSVIFDSVLGGGVPKGTYIELSSKSGLGKTTAVLHFSKVACSLGHSVIYLDFEQGVNRKQLDGIGLTPYIGENFFLYQPVTFQDGEKIIDELSGEDGLVYIIIDSITSMLPESVRTQSVSKMQPGIHARLASKFLLKYKALARQKGIVFFYITQTRYKLNFMGTSKEVAAGGNAQKFFSDIRLQMSLQKYLEKKQDTLEGDQKIKYGANVSLWAVKSRYERPFIECTCTIIYGKGISNMSAYYSWLVKKGIIVQNSSWFTIKLGDIEDKVQGEVSVHQWIRENQTAVKEYIADNGGFLLVAKETDGGL